MNERRRAARLRVTAEIRAKVKAIHEARFLDLSEAGALLEVDHPLLPKARCDLRIRRGKGETVLSATVHRCLLVGHADGPSGRRTLVYHAAVEFREEDREAARELAETLSQFEGSAAASLGSQGD